MFTFFLGRKQTKSRAVLAKAHAKDVENEYYNYCCFVFTRLLFVIFTNADSGVG